MELVVQTEFLGRRGERMGVTSRGKDVWDADRLGLFRLISIMAWQVTNTLVLASLATYWVISPLGKYPWRNPRTLVTALLRCLLDMSSLPVPGAWRRTLRGSPAPVDDASTGGRSKSPITGPREGPATAGVAGP